MITTLWPAHCQLGENPLWHAESGTLYWTDIVAGELHRLHLASRSHEILYRGPTVGGFTFQESGDLLLFRLEDVALLRLDGSLTVLRRFDDEGSKRFNDVIADPAGRVYAGTMGRTDTSGGLFLFERDLPPRLLFRGTGIANGMGFSPDRRTFYWTCSTRRRIYAFDYEAATGALTRERVLYQATDEEGIPDGMTVDAEGHLWSARWDGFSVAHHAPDGRVLERIAFPVAQVSSLCLGGEKLDEFLVTTAGGKPGAAETADGNLFRFPAPAPGPIEFRSRISG